MLEVAGEKPPDAELLEGPLEALPLAGGSVDLVVCALALMHVRDLGAVLREFVRVLRPGGQIVVSDIRGIVGDTVSPLIKFGHDGEPRYVPEWARPTSQYIETALGLGLEVRFCREIPGPVPFVDDGVAAGDVAREQTKGEPPDRWALHRYAPQATNAAAPMCSSVSSSCPTAAADPGRETARGGGPVSGRYWARTSDLHDVNVALSQLS